MNIYICKGVGIMERTQMLIIWLISILCFITLIILYYWFRSIINKLKDENAEIKINFTRIKTLVKVFIVFSIIILQLASDAIYRYEQNNFKIEIGNTLNEIDFEILYDEMYKKSHAESDLLANTYSAFYLDQEGNILDFNLNFVVPKHGALYYYSSYFEKGNLYFNFEAIVQQFFKQEYLNLDVYLKRLETLDYVVFTDYLKDSDFEDGLRVYLNFQFNDEAKVKTVEDANYDFDFYVIDQDNKILRNQKYTVKDHFFTVSIDKLVEEDDEFGGKVLNGKRYDSIPKAIIDVLIAK